jgi:curved DNA-binding protein CbpA
MPQSNSWGFPRWGGYGKDSEAVTVQLCEWEGCTEKGDYPAPKFRDSKERYWFCQEHAGEYNRSWNYFSGMTEEEAKKAAEKEEAYARNFRDGNTWQFADISLTKEERERRTALKVLDLDEHASQAEIKESFRTLAKQHHPDTNPGDEAAEERFKSVCAAYEILKT